MVLHIPSGSTFEAEIGYSRALVDGNMIYVSGTTGYDYVTMTLPSDPAVQAANALATIAHVLDEVGSSLKDVVRVRYYLANRADLDAIKPILSSHFNVTRPAATMLVTGLMEPEMKIEIEVTARVGAGYN